MDARAANDPFADALESYWLTGTGSYRYTRQDGWSSVEDAWWYFTNYREFPPIEKRALKFARGRVLDIGCGAGRHALYLQRKRLKVTGVEASPRVAMIASARGVKDVRIGSACGKLPLRDGEFDTVILFGNNLGICGSVQSTGRMLRELARVTSARGRILLTTLIPGVFDSNQLAHYRGKLERGEELGVMRFILTFQGGEPKEVTLLVLAPSELMRLAWKNGWCVEQVFPGARPEDGYAAVLEKRA